MVNRISGVQSIMFQMSQRYSRMEAAMLIYCISFATKYSISETMLSLIKMPSIK